MARRSTALAGELAAEHLFLVVEVPHTHAGSTEQHVMAGQLIGFHRSEIDVELYLDMHSPRRTVTVLLDTQITVLNAPEDDRPIPQFGR